MPSVRIEDDPPGIVSSQQPVIVCFRPKAEIMSGLSGLTLTSALHPEAATEIELLRRSAKYPKRTFANRLVILSCIDHE